MVWQRLVEIEVKAGLRVTVARSDDDDDNNNDNKKDSASIIEAAFECVRVGVTWVAEFKATIPIEGNYRLWITLRDQAIPGSPFAVPVFVGYVKDGEGGKRSCYTLALYRNIYITYKVS